MSYRAARNLPAGCWDRDFSPSARELYSEIILRELHCRDKKLFELAYYGGDAYEDTFIRVANECYDSDVDVCTAVDFVEEAIQAVDAD